MNATNLRLLGNVILAAGIGVLLVTVAGMASHEILVWSDYI